MKKIIYFMAALLLAVGVQAQTADGAGLQKFFEELKALKGEHVMYKSFDKSSSEKDFMMELPFTFMLGKIGDINFTNRVISTTDATARYVLACSDDETGYNLINGILDKYYTVENEEIFGIPLMACKREDGEEQTVFMNKGNTLLIRECKDDVEIVYINFNLADSITNIMQEAVEKNFGEASMNVEMFGGINMNITMGGKGKQGKKPVTNESPSANSDDILAYAHNIYDKQITLLKSRLSKAEGKEQRKEISTMLDKLKEEKNERIEELKEELEELDGPEFVEIIPGTGEHYVAIPKISADLKNKVKPYAANGVYDWINSTGFCKGAPTLNFDRISCIVTPRDVAMQYVIRNFPRNKWYDDGFTTEYKETAAVEFQGGTPAVLYSFSRNEKSYKGMLSDFGHLFDRKVGQQQWGLKVAQQINRGGKRFVQLYGEGNIIMSLFDSPEDKYCHMSIIIGGISGFEQAVNEYIFGGEQNIARKCNVIIDNDLSDNSYGIHFTTDEYSHAGNAHKNGVHINFGYIEKLKNK